MEFGILGPVEIRVGDRRLPSRGPRQRTLLAMLAVHANQVVSVDRLIEAMWGESPPSTATAQVQSHVSALRRALDEGGPAGAGRELLVTRPPGYLLTIGPGRLDLHAFDRRIEQARAAGCPRDTAEGLRAALALWRGQALDGTTGLIAAAEAARLEERRLAVLEERAQADLASGEHTELVAELTALVAEHPVRDRLRGQLMLALYRAGRQAEALAVYQHRRTALADEFGVDPERELQQLEQRILIGDAALLPVPAPVRVRKPPAGRVDQPVRAQSERPTAALIWTKLHTPVDRELVPRRALVERLRSARPRKLTLLRAPAGWGKSSLLAVWHASERETRPFAWFALDRGDNDPLRFWTYLIEALRTLDPELGVNSLPLLRAPGIDPVTEVLPVLINELDAAARRSVLVLDDYHLIDNAAIDDGIALLLEHLPSTLELVITTRTEPALPLARLRVRRELTEIDAEALRFSPTEAGTLVNDQHGLTLNNAEIARLHERTEGWAAGLSLATRTLQGRADPRALIDTFAGDHRHIVDYLNGEVLADQPATVRAFLLRTSILDRLNAPLCDAVTGTPGSARTLAALERSNTFLFPLDLRRRWYRYHHLFGELLRRELVLAESDHVPELHRRAAGWHLDAGLIAEGIDHTIAAGDLPDATELVAAHWSTFVQYGKAHIMDGWLDSIGDLALHGDARMCLIRAWTWFALGRVAEMPPWTDAAETAPLPGPFRDGTTSVAAGVATLRAAYWLIAGDMRLVGLHAEAAIHLQQDPTWRANGAHCAGVAAYWLGDTTEAIEHLEHDVRHGQDAFQLVIYALGHLAMIHAEQAEWDRAEARAGAALRLADEHRTGEYWMLAMAHITWAKLLQHRDHLDEAESAAVRGIELARRGNIAMDVSYGLLTLAQVRHDRRDPDGAGKLLDQAHTVAVTCPDPGRLPDMIEVARRRFRAHNG